MGKATIHYYDIGDYLSREEKLSIIKKLKTVANPQMEWTTLQPNEHGDWISQRNDVFGTFIPLGDKEYSNSVWIKGIYCRGLETARDSWVYQSNKSKLLENIKTSIDFFNSESDRFQEKKTLDKNTSAKDVISYDDTQISWSRAFVTDIENRRKKTFDDKCCVKSIYRPFFKQHLYFSREQNNVVSRMDSFFPSTSLKNQIICVPGIGGTKDSTVYITDCIPDVQLQFNGQCFPLYYYEERPKSSPTLFDSATEEEYIRRDGISDFIWDRAKKQYGAKNISKEDIFYYVYGFLHNPEYRETFSSDLKKMLPRIPLVEEVKDFWSFSNAGRKLADLHINYEKVPPYSGVTLSGDVVCNRDNMILRLQTASPEPTETNLYLVDKMRFPKKGQKDTIIYNSHITISNIPEKAYEYVVNGKSAIEWIMERYQITTHKESGIRNDPNDWSTEVGNPRYILDLLLSIINVSIQTVEIVESLPKLKFE
jgi:predicted helicase